MYAAQAMLLILRKCTSLFSLGRFPFRIYGGTVELELQAKLVDKGNRKNVMLCPDLCICKDIGEHLNRLVKVNVDISRSRTLAFIQDMPTIEVRDTIDVSFLRMSLYQR